MKKFTNLTKYLLYCLILTFSFPLESKSQNLSQNAVIPNGFGVQLKTGDVATLDRVKNLGLKWVRRRFSWEIVEPVKGTYDFSYYDAFVKDCKDRGLSIIGCMAFSHPAYSHAKDEPGRTGYANFAAAIAERYKDYNIIWEIWNEPNTMTFWGNHGGVGNSDRYANEYTTLVRAVVPAMKNANPNCMIAAGAVSNLWSESYNWMTYCFRNHDMLEIDWDVWSLHPYGLKAPEDYIEAYAISKNLMTNAKGDKNRVWIDSERGFNLKTSEGALYIDYQAWRLVRQYLIDMLEGFPLTIWYEWGGSDGYALYKSGDPEYKPFKACKVLIQELTGYSLDKRISLSNGRDFLLQFKNANGNVKLVAWAGPPVNQYDTSITPHTINIPINTTKSAIPSTDIYGIKSEIEVKVGVLDVYLTGAPVYIDLGNEAVSAVSDVIENEVKVYFNQSDCKLTVSSLKAGINKILLYDLYGKCVLKEENNSTEFNVSLQQLHSGAYVLQVLDNNNNSFKSHKIIKI